MHFCLQVATVDSFQGAEKDVIILSTVRTGQRGLSGFLTSERRVNVAVTRARHHLVLVGHVGTLLHEFLMLAMRTHNLAAVFALLVRLREGPFVVSKPPSGGTMTPFSNASPMGFATLVPPSRTPVIRGS